MSFVNGLEMQGIRGKGMMNYYKEMDLEELYFRLIYG